MASKCIETWHHLAKTQDAAGIPDLLSDDVVFYSPVVHTPQVGKEITAKYLATAFEVFFNDTFHYTAENYGDNQAVLEFEVELDGIKVNGVDMISWNDQQLITAFKVMVRPLKGVNIVHQLMMEQLTRS